MAGFAALSCDLEISRVAILSDRNVESYNWSSGVTDAPQDLERGR
jgi:hypothetical protein